MPDVDATRHGRSPRPRSRSSGSGGIGYGGVGGAIGQNLANTSQVYNAQQDQAYLNALAQALGGGQQQGGMSGGRSYVSGGGGGGGGPGAYDLWRIQQEKERQARLEQQKKVLELGLAGQKQAAVPRIQQYGREATQRVNNAYGQNQRLTGQYSQQLKQLGSQMSVGARNELAGLQRDMAGQGVTGQGPEIRAMQAAAGQNIQGQQFLQNNADAYNVRLAQVMGGAKADALSTAGTVTSAGLGDLENNYLQALMQIRMMGLM